MMNILKLKEKQDKINENALKEVYHELPIGIINFTKSFTAKQRIENFKSGRKTDQSARVLNNWINQGLLGVSTSDKGRIKRFNRITSIWLNIIVEARKFGLSLDYLKQTQKDLFISPIEDFNLIKFSVLESILRQPKMLLIFDEGHTKILSSDTYTEYISHRFLPSHLSFRLLDFIIPEFPKNAFEIDFKIENVYDHPNKVTLLYYLKTGDFKYIKIFLSETDIRIIEHSSQLSENSDLCQSISKWEFEKILIFIEDEVEPVLIS